MDMRIRSEGCNDPEKTADTCGIAYLYVNGVNHSLRKRGFNIVVADTKTGEIRLRYPLTTINPPPQYFETVGLSKFTYVK